MKEKIKKLYFKYIGSLKRKKFKNTNFTIISNNCFGGIIYRNHHMPYLTPTAGLFIMPDDYLKFIKNIKKYIKIEPIEISVNESKYKKYLNKINYGGTIGKIEDVEIMFLHYHNFKEAKEKWIKRCKRINFDRIIYKFNDQNECTFKNLKEFNDLDLKNKICFTARKYEGIDSYVLSKFSDAGYVLDDTKNKNIKYAFDIYEYINNITGEKK